ncbi:hypothetical protein ACERZ8_07640 [Tateyamaria armeniaca]|uniref:Uncharacterized protein n=1 Tax=Tateyamaria armeniaca TaxID=2518930 RepID=A0ABW8US91_9RHOB
MADWEYRTPAEVAAQADLIVSGVLTGRVSEEIAGSGNLQNIGTVSIDKVFKGTADGDTVAVILAPTRPGGLVSSADVLIADGQAGLWYLQATERAGLFAVKRPDQFVPADEAAEQIKALASE